MSLTLLSSVEQMEAALSEGVAPMLKNYRKRLQELGFSPKESFELIRDVQSSLLSVSVAKASRLRSPQKTG